MTVEVAKDVLVELQNDQIMASNQARYKSEHKKLHVVVVVGLLKLTIEAIGVVLRIIESVDG